MDDPVLYSYIDGASVHDGGTFSKVMFQSGYHFGQDPARESEVSGVKRGIINCAFARC